MLRPADSFFASLPEPARGCLSFLRTYIQQHDPDITETWKYGMPVYCYKGKMLCYLWKQKKDGTPYIGFVDGNRMDDPLLLQEQRSRMKIFLLDPYADLPLQKLRQLLQTAVALRKDRPR